MNIAPFHPDPLVVAFFDAVSLPALAVTAGLALHRLIGRLFA
jgi:hypothetical protein